MLNAEKIDLFCLCAVFEVEHLNRQGSIQHSDNIFGTKNYTSVTIISIYFS